MSRSGYVEDYENINLWRGAVERAIKGKRGQQFLREMAEALDTMPTKRLVRDALIDPTGEVCAIGAVCRARGLDVSGVEVYDPAHVAMAVGIATALAAEIEYINDEANYRTETPEQRWERVRKWVSEQVKEPTDEN